MLSRGCLPRSGVSRAEERAKGEGGGGAGVLFDGAEEEDSKPKQRRS